MGSPWLLALDLDGVVWDHLDVSSLLPPFRPLAPGRFTSSDGVIVEVHWDVVELLYWAKRSGALAVTLSWNEPGHALEALRVLGLRDTFDYHGIDPHPWKGRVLASVLERVWRERGLRIPACRIVYVDDRDIHVDDVKRHVGPVVFIRYGAVKGFENLVKHVMEGLAGCNSAD